jgi:hypothetical protein
MGERIDLIGPVKQILTDNGPMTATEIKVRLEARKLTPTGIGDLVSIMSCVFVQELGEETAFRIDKIDISKCKSCEFTGKCLI